MKRSWLLPSTMDRRSSLLCNRHSKIFKAHPADKTGNDPIEVRYLTVGRQMLEASAEILPCRAAIVYPARWGGSHNFAPSIDLNNPKRVNTTQQPNFVNRIMEPALKIMAISQVKSGSEKGCTLMYIYIYINPSRPSIKTIVTKDMLDKRDNRWLDDLPPTFSVPRHAWSKHWRSAPAALADQTAPTSPRTLGRLSLSRSASSWPPFQNVLMTST